MNSEKERLNVAESGMKKERKSVDTVSDSLKQNTWQNKSNGEQKIRRKTQALQFQEMK